MPEIILHHYPESPFSEKIRLLLGYKGVDYHSVIIPMIMPKPDLMPLTGGYRKTPVMQIGADIYCDTAIIAQTIDALHPRNTIYPKGSVAAAGMMAHWADTFFFKVCVQVAFQPRALANNSILSNPERASAFAADRAELSKGSTELRMPLANALPYFHQQLTRLDAELGAAPGFLLGDAPTIADFSVYHCLWFVAGNPALADLFAPHKRVSAWMEKMRGLGRSEAREMTGKAALEIARGASPAAAPAVEHVDVEDFKAGDNVEVMPIDYGFNPVAGRLVIATTEEIAVTRSDAATGEVAVHFPRLGFQVKRKEG